MNNLKNFVYFPHFIVKYSKQKKIFKEIAQQTSMYLPSSFLKFLSYLLCIFLRNKILQLHLKPLVNTYLITMSLE